MFKRSIKHTILLNIGAFVLVAVLEILSIWTIRDRFDTFSFFLRGINYAVVIMSIAWVNHFLLIPFFLDKRRYILYGFLLVATILLGSYIKGYSGGWEMVSKFFFFLVYATGTGMAAFLLHRNIIIQRETAEKDKLQKEMALNYLKEQVNPHFLFNSLNSIYSLSRQQSPETPTMVMQLSELLRYQLESAKKEKVKLKEELEFLENYLLLEEKRLSQRCTIEYSLKGEFGNFTIAPMLLIPFVENAVKHGAQSTNETSHIDISAAMNQESLLFQVVNSKPKQAVPTTREGMGLDNVKRRLHLLYPNSHKLRLENKAKEFRVHLQINLSVEHK